MGKDTETQTPVFVWRTTTPPLGGVGYSSERPEALCTYCNAELDVHRISEFEGDERLGELYREAYSRVCASASDMRNLGHAETAIERFDNAYIPLRAQCAKCGWWMNRIRYGRDDNVLNTCAAALTKFDIKDPRVRIPELRSHLAEHFSDIRALPPRRVEEVIGDLYADQGYEVRLTKHTRDGGG
jgi:hypothetical protein